MNTALKCALAATGLAIATQAVAQVTFYEGDNFQGRSFTTKKKVGNLETFGFNDRASSAIVARDRWEACEDARFRGTCRVLRPGRYASLAAMGLNNRVSSVRLLGAKARIADDRYAPAPVAAADYRRRGNERLYEAQVTSVRAVVGPPEQRCWVEREQVEQDRDRPNMAGGIAGAVIGGILGHQIGGGRGQSVATVGGAVAGAAIGANVGRDRGQGGYGEDVRHCRNPPSRARADYWDVTYEFRGDEHRVQLSAPPGRTVTVNAQGEPRG